MSRSYYLVCNARTGRVLSRHVTETAASSAALKRSDRGEDVRLGKGSFHVGDDATVNDG